MSILSNVLFRAKSFRSSAIGMGKALPQLKKAVRQLRENHDFLKSSQNRLSVDVKNEVAECRRHFGNLSGLHEKGKRNKFPVLLHLLGLSDPFTTRICS